MSDPAPLPRAQAAAHGLRTVLVGIAVNAVLAAIKAVAGVVGNSYALVADAIESTADVAQSLIVYAGLSVAATPADQDHPYGHGKAEPLAALAVAGALGIAGIAIAAQSVREILTPHLTPAPFTLAVLAIVVLVKEGLFRYALGVGRDAGSTAVQADAWHHRSDAFTSAAAFVGISVALAAGPGWESADDWAALLASGIILWNARRLMRPALAELMDHAPPPEVVTQIRSVAAAVPGVRGLDKCFVRKMGFDVFVDLHVLVDGAATVREGHAIAHRVKDALRGANPRVADVLVHVEPMESERPPVTRSAAP